MDLQKRLQGVVYEYGKVAIVENEEKTEEHFTIRL